MNPKNIVRGAAVAILFSSASVFAHPGFNTLFGCFAYVHDGCYVGTDSPCSEEDYNDLLDGCYGHFPAEIAKPRPINKLMLPGKETTQKQSYKLKIMNMKRDLRR